MTVDRDDPTPTKTDWADDQLLLTPEAAARVLSIGRTSLFALLKEGNLHSVHIGRSCRITRAELKRYVARLDAPAMPAPTSGKHPRRTPANQDGLFDLEPPPDAA
jgi:excisionase family DNA binding protein